MKLAVLYAVTALVPSAFSHCLITGAYGNANHKIRSYGIGLLEDTNRGVDSRVDGQRDCTVFSDPAMTPNGSGARQRKCTLCPAGFDTECGACRGVKNCQKCPLYDTNCSKCRKRHLPGCGRTYYASSSKYYVVDHPELKGTDPARPFYNSAYIHTANWIEWLREKGKIPIVTAGGWLWVTMFQQTTDGAGPYYCMLDQAGKGEEWVNMTVPVVSPGIQGASPCNNQNWEWPLKLPQDLKCTGEYGALKNVCLAKCFNDAPNGPFGGCIAFQQVESGPDMDKEPRSFETNPKCRGFQYRLPISDGQIRFLAGDDSIGAVAKAYIRDMLKPGK
ncbi:hypothetical protein EYR41_009694 [Orbilia oligospora]|uniref:Uncharacterized protein n=1 Tax=Orbilia oligospora TaxID=2813651 RepID=A0A8H2HNL4_ORBOL|nr:hypothetical protein EYR41_009694 [Orbilia oligospora]